MSSARNIGLKEAAGEYICFVDSDDYVAPSYCEKLLRLILKYNVQIAACQLLRVRGDEAPEQSSEYDEIRVKKADKWLNILNNQNSAEGYVFNKIYSKNALSGICFDESVSMCEDQLFTFLAMSNVDDIAVSSEPLYFYRYNMESACHNLNQIIFEQEIYVAKKIVQIVECNGNEISKNACGRLLYGSYFQLCRYLAGYRPSGWKQVYNKQRDHAIKCGLNQKLKNTKRLLIDNSALFCLYARCWASGREIRNWVIRQH